MKNDADLSVWLHPEDEEQSGASRRETTVVHKCIYNNIQYSLIVTLANAIGVDTPRSP